MSDMGRTASWWRDMGLKPANGVCARRCCDASLLARGTGIRAVSALLAFALITQTATAQSNQRLSVQLSGIFAGLQGSVHTNLGPGAGGEAQVRYTIGTLSLGAGVQYTRHDYALAGTTFPVAIAGPFLEPRYVLPMSLRDIAPYVSARYAVLRQRYSFAGFDGSSTGTTLNGGGGALVRLGSRMNLDIGATYGFTSFRQFTINDRESGERTKLPAGSGSNVIARIGLAFGLGG